MQMGHPRSGISINGDIKAGDPYFVSSRLEQNTGSCKFITRAANNCTR